MSTLTVPEPLAKPKRRASGIIHQHYRIVPGFAHTWVGRCKTCETTTKAMTPAAAERPMIQHLEAEHGIVLEGASHE